MSDLVKNNRVNFSKKAALYDKYAIFQKDVADILLSQLEVVLSNANLKDSLVLDLGAGTGFSSSKLKDITSAKKITHLDHSYEMLNLAKKNELNYRQAINKNTLHYLYKNSNPCNALIYFVDFYKSIRDTCFALKLGLLIFSLAITALVMFLHNLSYKQESSSYLCADMHNLPFAIHQNQNKFDVVYSNLAMQWCTDIPNLLKDLKSVLKEDGCLAFSTILDGSLSNMKIAYGKLDRNPPVQDFLSYEYLIDLIKYSGFKCIFCESKKMTYNFPTILSLLNSFKKIGASYAGNAINNGFITKTFFERLSYLWPKDELDNFILDYTIGLFVLINV
jgi:ubiquinone/menaquinone biosynthesis C-methylase UbiE